MREPRVVAIVQARLGSTRLPGKALVDIAGQPMLAWVVRRLQRARTLHEVAVATTTHPRDAAIADAAHALGARVFRGSEEDVLDRYHRAAAAFRADVIVRITSDCPLVDPELVDEVVRALDRPSRVDYTSNTIVRRTLPRGLDAEAVRRHVLDRAWWADRDPASREHVTPYVYRHPEAFSLRSVPHDEDLSEHRWTVDTQEDLELVRRIAAAFPGDDFGYRAILELVRANPSWQAINAHVVQKAVG